MLDLQIHFLSFAHIIDAGAKRLLYVKPNFSRHRTVQIENCGETLLIDK